ncbi:MULTISPECIES: sensory rhodopsin I [Halobacterium]|uniref:sensory rhodopsin I n=1 Tax=Halobacterium TaxID=2239 RepID=UPI0019662074|nr:MULTISPECIES: sensory rhodopsin I [Halobacterium]MDL0128399.1 sensory rhodopsin I [Halobacterium salinarum]QRY24054.1 bacteriorhodopsin [Halobacterium sp. BOL4-2]
MDAVATAYLGGAVALIVGVAFVWLLYRSLDGSPHQSALAPLAIIPVFAGLSYVGMAYDIGTVIVNGNEIVGLRYIDWLVTTPILVGYVGYAAGASRRSIIGVMVADALMIAVGAGAVVTDGTLKWALFGVSSIFHLSLFAYLYVIFPRVVPDVPEQIGLFNLLKNHIGLLWLAYPLVWLFGPAGIGEATAAGVALTYVFLDVLAKVPYVYFFYARRRVFMHSGSSPAPEQATVEATAAD